MMVTEFEKLLKRQKPPPDSTRTFIINLKCVETKQQFELTHTVKVCDLYQNSGEVRMALMHNLDQVFQAFVRTLPI